jgi:hypothetical protein
MKFKFVTSGQSSADAAITDFILRGNSLRPLGPVNLHGIRDFEANLVVECTRRSRLGQGLRPGSDVPIGEEEEKYEMDIFNGSNVVRTIRFNPKDPEVPMWQLNHYAAGQVA